MSRAIIVEALRWITRQALRPRSSPGQADTVPSSAEQTAPLAATGSGRRRSAGRERMLCNLIAAMLALVVLAAGCGRAGPEVASAPTPANAASGSDDRSAGVGAEAAGSRGIPAPPEVRGGSEPGVRRAPDADRPVPFGAEAGPAIAPARPVAVEIPRIGVDSGLQRLGLNAAGAVAAPTAWDTAGWFTQGVQPGQPGPAVVAGHVDSTDGPAVFYDLAELEPGDEVAIRRDDGSRLTFQVTSTDRYPKDRFPVDAVYGPVPRPELRLVTCGGVFDDGSGHYRDNVVVSAELASG